MRVDHTIFVSSRGRILHDGLWFDQRHQVILRTFSPSMTTIRRSYPVDLRLDLTIEARWRRPAALRLA